VSILLLISASVDKQLEASAESVYSSAVSHDLKLMRNQVTLRQQQSHLFIDREQKKKILSKS